MFNTMDDEALVDFATGLVNTYDWLKLAGQRGTDRFEAVESLWNETREELTQRGPSVLAEVLG
jgi:hypothetical protein